MVVHLAATPHVIAVFGVVGAVAGASAHGVAVEDLDVLPFHSGVADEVEGRGEPGQPAADDVGFLLLCALHFLRMGEGFVISCGIIHGEFSPLAFGHDQKIGNKKAL